MRSGMIHALVAELIDKSMTVEHAQANERRLTDIGRRHVQGGNIRMHVIS